VLLIIPAYIYDFGPIKEITVLGEVLAISALLMCMLFVTLDLGHPERIWHLFPFIGTPNFPVSLLTWDILVVNGYLFINIGISTYLLAMIYLEKKETKWLYMPLVLASIPWAVAIHTVTAYLYNALGARPFWNTAPHIFITRLARVLSGILPSWHPVSWPRPFARGRHLAS
jgi:molybdopterin-containing oxidoreductase family membrane subunit